MSRRRCAFCGAAGVTNEHVIGKWALTIPAIAASRESAPQGNPNVMLRPDMVWDKDFTDVSAVVLRSEVKGRQIFPADVKVKAVCGNCNSQWMAQLGDRFRDAVLLPYLAAGGDLALDAELADVAARWMFKTVAMFEFNDPPTKTIGIGHLRSFHGGVSIPPGVRVDVFRGPGPDGYLRMTHWGGQLAGINRAEGRVGAIVGGVSQTLFCLGDFGLRLSYAMGTSLDSLRIPADSRMRQIYPFVMPVKVADERVTNEQWAPLAQHLAGLAAGVVPGSFNRH